MRYFVAVEVVETGGRGVDLGEETASNSGLLEPLETSTGDQLLAPSPIPVGGVRQVDAPLDAVVGLGTMDAVCCLLFPKNMPLGKLGMLGISSS